MLFFTPLPLQAFLAHRPSPPQKFVLISQFDFQTAFPSHSPNADKTCQQIVKMCRGTAIKKTANMGRIFFFLSGHLAFLLVFTDHSTLYGPILQPTKPLDKQANSCLLDVIDISIIIVKFMSLRVHIGRVFTRGCLSRLASDNRKSRENSSFSNSLKVKRVGKLQ